MMTKVLYHREIGNEFLPPFGSLKMTKSLAATDTYSNSLQYSNPPDPLSPARQNESFDVENEKPMQRFIDCFKGKLSFHENHFTRDNYSEPKSYVEMSNTYYRNGQQQWPEQIQDISYASLPDQFSYPSQNSQNHYFNDQPESNYFIVPTTSNVYWTGNIQYNQYNGSPCQDDQIGCVDETNISYQVAENQKNGFANGLQTTNSSSLCSDSLHGAVSNQNFDGINNSHTPQGGYPMPEYMPTSVIRTVVHHQTPVNGSLKRKEQKISDASTSISKCKWAGCGIIFPCTAELGEHIKRCHIKTAKKAKFVCLWEGCDRDMRPFCARYKLLIHTRIHSGDKPYKCSYFDRGCSKAFKTVESMKIHERTHGGEKPCKCSYEGCTKSYNNASDCKKHLKTHYDKQPFACKAVGCNKRYSDPSSLRKHKRRHLVEKRDKDEGRLVSKL